MPESHVLFFAAVIIGGLFIVVACIVGIVKVPRDMGLHPLFLMGVACGVILSGLAALCLYGDVPYTLN